MALFNFTSGIRLTKSINSSRGEWAQQQHVLPSTYKGGDAEFCCKKETSIMSGLEQFFPTQWEKTAIQHLSKTVRIQVAQHLKAHCSIMWMIVGTDLS